MFHVLGGGGGGLGVLGLCAPLHCRLGGVLPCPLCPWLLVLWQGTRPYTSCLAPCCRLFLVPLLFFLIIGRCFSERLGSDKTTKPHVLWVMPSSHVGCSTSGLALEIYLLNSLGRCFK